MWAREHYKSTVITFAKTIQDILANYGEDPLGTLAYEPTFLILSHQNKQASSFMGQIMNELTINATLKEFFPDILYENPHREAPRWSVQGGMVVRRQSNPKEPSVGCSGLVDGMPTGMHYNVLIYDDVVTKDSVTTSDMIRKTTESWEMSENLTAGEDSKIRMIGTRYHFADTWGEILKRKAAKPRIYPCTDDGTIEGKAVLRSQEFINERYLRWGPYTFSSQMLQNPVADSTQGFQREWLRWYDDPENHNHMNLYILVDPANEKKKSSDYTAIAVVGLGPDQNIYLIDLVRDRLNLQERAQMVMEMHRKYRPKQVGYEKYGMQSDIDYLKEIQSRDNYRFDIQETGGSLAKVDRIKRLIPIASEKRLYFPRGIHRTTYDGKLVDLVNVLVEEEMMGFPVSLHDDALDAISRIFDVDMVWPKVRQEPKRDRYDSKPKRSWMA